jgi:arylsulfatase
MIEQIAGEENAKPFFAYLTFTAPHSPLQAPEEDIARHANNYRDGWSKLAQSRLASMRKAGVLPGKLPHSAESFGPQSQSWDALSPGAKAREARRMAIYAAMVERMDHNIGRVLAALKQSGQIDNTVILFLSDNGPADEDPRQYAVMPGFTDRYGNADNSPGAMGTSRSFVLQDPRWASAIAAPSRLFKGFVTEGGTLVPMIIRAPGIPVGGVNQVIGDMRDIAPTLLALAGIEQEETVNGMQVAAIEGGNLMPWLTAGTDDRPISQVAFGFNGQGSVRAGPWKAIRLIPPIGDAQWHLYNTIDDPAETSDRKADKPERFAAMMTSWEAYAARHGLNEKADLQPMQLRPKAR